MYLLSDDGNDLVAVTSEGVEAETVARLSVTHGAIGRAFADGEVAIRYEGEMTEASIDKPVVIIPMHMDGRVLGAIAIFGTLPQKTEFVYIDRELFKLLGAQAAPALINARLFTDAGRKVPGLQAFLDLED